MTRSRTYQVKDVARLTGVSVRTLHHYDAIGLLVPGARTAAGYRLYTDADLLRLQQILIGRELGLPLEEIRRSLDDPRFDRKTALLDQRQRLRDRARQAEAMIRAIDVALAALDGSGKTGEITMEDLFDGFDPSRYEEEARQQWGTTDAFVESEKRTRRYTPDDWKALKAEQAAVYDAAFSALKAGKAPSTQPRWTSPSGIVCPSTAGSIRAATRCIAGWRRCTRATIASGRASTSMERA